MKKSVILVDVFDNEIGEEEKMSAHKNGRLHRAFSIFVLNKEEELLMQQRSSQKYHSAELWSNTCCSHPLAGEVLQEAAERRLTEEMGFTSKLQWLFHFIYRAEFSNGLIEHELDHVFLGYYNLDPTPDPLEVKNWRWQSIHILKEDIKKEPAKYTYWFKHIYDKFYDALNNLQ